MQGKHQQAYSTAHDVTYDIGCDERGYRIQGEVPAWYVVFLLEEREKEYGKP